MRQRHVLNVLLLSSLIIALLGFFVIEPDFAHARRKKRDSLLDVVGKKIDAALVTAPKDEETCFSPDEPCDTKLVKFINTAQTSIDIAIFDINIDELVHHLLVLVKSKSIRLRIVVDKRQAKGDHSLVPTLIKGGANLRIGKQRGIMHDKFVIVDGKMLETGSFNFTNHAYQANQENQVYLSKPGIVQSYQARFEKIWATAMAGDTL